MGPQLKILNLKGKEVVCDIRQSKWPLKTTSKSKLQHEVGQTLQEYFPRAVILEDFVIPGSRLSVDFFLPQHSIVVEVDPESSHEYNSFFHGPRESCKFGRQLQRESQKAIWCENNNFKLYSIVSVDDLKILKK